MTRTERLCLVLALNVALVAVLLAVGLSTRSLGVLAEGADYLADAAGIGVTLLALWLSGRPPNPARPGAYRTAPAWAALVNGGWLLVACLAVAFGSLRHLAQGTPAVHGEPVLVVSAVASVVMLAGALILRGEPDGPAGDVSQLSLAATLLDTAADAAAAAGVALSGLVIWLVGGLYWLDPSVALVISGAVGYHALRLLGRVAHALR